MIMVDEFQLISTQKHENQHLKLYIQSYMLEENSINEHIKYHEDFTEFELL
jgi:hypothetical protein